MKKPPENSVVANSAVPLFGSWPKAYLAVTVAFAVEVTFFFFVSRYFS